MLPDSAEGQINIRMSTYCVAFIDLLGQKDLYGKISPDLKLCSGDEEIILEMAKATFGLQQDMQCAFSTYSDTPRHGYSLLPEELHPAYEKMSNHEVFLQKFSDGMVIFVNLSKSESHYALSSLVPALASIAFSFLGALNRGYPFRGGIALGKGFQRLPDGLDEIYGPVVAKAYQLESIEAGYPRIVLDENIVGYISAHVDREGDNDLEVAGFKTMARHLLRAISEDTDGKLILDYLALNVACADDTVPISEEIAKGYRFINSQIDIFREAGNSLLLGRYSLLKAYWDSREEILRPYGFVVV